MANPYNAEQMRRLVAQGKAIRNDNGDPSYPIVNRADLQRAIHAVGRAGGSHDRIRRYIVRRAKALGATNLLPDNWTTAGASR